MITLRNPFLILLLCLALSACTQFGRPEPEPVAPAASPTAPPTATAQGLGRFVPNAKAVNPEEARQQAFMAALVDGLGKAVPTTARVLPAGENEDGRELVVLSGSGRVEEFLVLRQQVLLAGRPVDDVTVAVRQDRVLVARNGLLVRMDPGLAPIFPAHTQDSPRFAGLAVRQVRFNGPADDPAHAEAGITCRVALFDPATLSPVRPEPAALALTGPVPEPVLVEADIPFDALVVDARQCRLAPTRLIRLLAPDGGELYGPGRVEAGVLVERGPAGFTTTYEKALVILSAWGAANPLTVRCEQAKGDGEIVLSAQGAEALVQADAQGGFLRQGRVVVLLPGDQAMP